MNKETPKAKWLSLSKETNALDYLERAADFIKETPKNVRAWKWVVISLHGALYGFAVAAARGTNYETVQTKKGRLLGFWEILNKCQDPNHMKMLMDSQHLELSDRQKKSINLLKKHLRNEFEHFKPRGWSIEIHGMPQIAIDILEVIHFLALKTQTYVNLNMQEEQLIDKLVKESIKFIRGTQLYAELNIAKELSKKVNPLNLPSTKR